MKREKERMRIRDRREEIDRGALVGLQERDRNLVGLEVGERSFGKVIEKRKAR